MGLSDLRGVRSGLCCHCRPLFFPIMESNQGSDWASVVHYMATVGDNDIDGFDTNTLRCYVKVRNSKNWITISNTGPKNAKILFNAAMHGEIDLTQINSIELKCSSTNVDSGSAEKLKREQSPEPADLPAFDSIIGLEDVKEALMNMLACD